MEPAARCLNDSDGKNICHNQLWAIIDKKVINKQNSKTGLRHRNIKNIKRLINLRKIY